MSNQKKGNPKTDKKAAAKTPKEKKEAKRQKKIEKNNDSRIV